MKYIYFLSAILFIFFATSCATIFSGTTQKIKIDSYPQGADIVIDGEIVGSTPAKVRVDRDFDTFIDGGKYISLESEGYEAHGYRLDTYFNFVSVLNLFNPVFWGIDVATGAIAEYDDYYVFELQPLAEEYQRAGSEIPDYKRIAELKDLLDSGAITQEEFEQEKAEILRTN